MSEEAPPDSPGKPVIIFIEGNVYDVTQFMGEHPGGKQVLARLDGRDATDGFQKVGHSVKARVKLASLLIAHKSPADFEKKAPIILSPTAHVGGSDDAARRRMMAPPPPSLDDLPPPPSSIEDLQARIDGLQD